MVTATPFRCAHTTEPPRNPVPGANRQLQRAPPQVVRPLLSRLRRRGQIDVLGNGTIEVGWPGLSRTEAGGADVQRYEVSVDGGPAFSVGTQASYRFTEAQRGRTYTFAVRAVNKAGEGGPWGARHRADLERSRPPRFVLHGDTHWRGGTVVGTTTGRSCCRGRLRPTTAAPPRSAATRSRESVALAPTSRDTPSLRFPAGRLLPTV